MVIDHTDNASDLKLSTQELKAITDAESSPPSKSLFYISSDLKIELVNLHLKGDLDSSSFSIHTSATLQKGKGAFASRVIQRGDLILVTLGPGVHLDVRFLGVASVLGFLLLPPATQICGKRVF